MNYYLSAPQLVLSRNNARGRSRADGSNKLKAQFADYDRIYINIRPPYDIQHSYEEPITVKNEKRILLYIFKSGVVLIPNNEKYTKKYVVAIIRAVPHKIYHYGYINGVNFRRCYILHTMRIIMNDTVKRLQIPDNKYPRIHIYRNDNFIIPSAFIQIDNLRIGYNNSIDYTARPLSIRCAELLEQIKNLGMIGQIHELQKFLNGNHNIDLLSLTIKPRI